MKNIVLIGMPGCGKSTIGRLLAATLTRSFYDSDEMIETRQKKSITQIFADNGEAFFRLLEADAIRSLSKLKDAVIATGGGAVMNTDSVRSLKYSGIIVFINRPTELIAKDIATDNRPLLISGKEKLYKLFETRLPVYRGCADIEIENTEPLPDIVGRIIMEVQKLENTCD